MEHSKELADLLERASREQDSKELEALIRRIKEILNQGRPKEPAEPDDRSGVKRR